MPLFKKIRLDNSGGKKNTPESDFDFTDVSDGSGLLNAIGQILGSRMGLMWVKQMVIHPPISHNFTIFKPETGDIQLPLEKMAGL